MSAASAFSGILLSLFALLVSATRLQAASADLPSLFAERMACSVAVEFYVETETERQESVSGGTVIDANGTIVLPPSAVNLRFSPSQLKAFKVFAPGDAVGTPSEYLGVDPLSGWHFVRAGSALIPRLKPITAFTAQTPPVPLLAEDLWGIGVRGKDEDFLPYLMTSRLAMINALPLRTGISQQELATPGLPVFNLRGDFVGLALSSFGQSFVQFSRNERSGLPVMMVNLEESSAFTLAQECMPLFARIPTNKFGRPMAWLGTYGLQPVDTEVARFLHLENQSAAVVSEVLEGSPAEKAGLKERDIIIALGSKTMPRFKPDRVVTAFIDHEVDRCRPGDSFPLTVLRDGKRVELNALLTDAPKLAREASRHFFDRVGLTAREFVFSDAVLRQVKFAHAAGVIAHFIKPSGPAAAAGLQVDDWIKQIDGLDVKNFEHAIERLNAIETDLTRNEFVLLVSRASETSVLRVKLK